MTDLLLGKTLKANVKLVVVRSSVQWGMKLGQGLLYKEMLIEIPYLLQNKVCLNTLIAQLLMV